MTSLVPANNRESLTVRQSLTENESEFSRNFRDFIVAKKPILFQIGIRKSKEIHLFKSQILHLQQFYRRLYN